MLLPSLLSLQQVEVLEAEDLEAEDLEAEDLEAEDLEGVVQALVLNKGEDNYKIL